ncbi:hypothetical protein [Nocardioides aurantiacus]|uniref:hypothetical protein n=1 Tax=Nocardioides aurantiacus TaxID=86796 RepID=UPI00403F94C2
MGVVGWVVGFVTFVVMAVVVHTGIDLVLDAWWASDGLDPAARPTNAALEWGIGTVAGLASGWGVTQLFGED